jgi:hypothetical protein
MASSIDGQQRRWLHAPRHIPMTGPVRQFGGRPILYIPTLLGVPMERDEHCPVAEEGPQGGDRRGL